MQLMPWLLPLALGVSTAISTAQSAEPTGTLTLACAGTIKEGRPPLGTKPEPTSMGIIVNFDTRTLEGFDSDHTFRIAIGNITETDINFSGSNVGDPARSYTYHIDGAIDRVTGAVEAMFHGSMKGGPTWSTSYSLKCEPTQRMF
jgi:hypothetical protein